MIAALRVTVGTGEKRADGTRLKSRLGDFCNGVRTSWGVFLTRVCWSAAVLGGERKGKKKHAAELLHLEFSLLWPSINCCFGTFFVLETVLVLSCCCCCCCFFVVFFSK